MISNRLRCTGRQVLVLLAAALVARAAMAQPGGPPGGRPDRGEFRGPGGPPGGGPGEGRPGRGGFRGRGGGPEAFLSRLDANGNGKIDPDESQGRARFFLQRAMPDADLSRPIPIEDLKRSLEKARSRRGGPPRGPDGAGREGDRDQGGKPSASEPKESAKPLTPGFGNEFSEIPVPGFDAEPAGKLPEVEINDDDKRRADFSFQRYDANRDGFITRDEARRSRGLIDFRADSNGDGRLSSAELSTHFARQRLQGQRGDGSRGGRDLGDRGDAGNRDRRSSRDTEGGEYRSESGSDGRKSYRFRTVEERLPEGLPEWFRERDADQDGQVAMAEFTVDWTEELAAKFNRLDANQDGIVTPEECLTSESAEVAATDKERSDRQSPPVSASETDASGVDPKYVRYAEGIVSKYDKNGDGVLASDEWSEMSKSPEDADADGNGRLTATEYATWLGKQ